MKKEELMTEIEELSELQFTIEEVSTITGIDIEKKAEYKKAFTKGRLKAQAIVRRQILIMAGNGSTPAAKQFMDLVEASEEWEE